MERKNERNGGRKCLTFNTVANSLGSTRRVCRSLASEAAGLQISSSSNTLLERFQSVEFGVVAGNI